MPNIACLDDIRAAAKKRIPRIFWDYVECGSWSQSTLQSNRKSFKQWNFRQRIGMDISYRSTASSFAGEPSLLPIAIAPTGMSGLLHPDGELAIAQAAARAGVPYTLSIASSYSLEDVRAVSPGTLWMQISLFKDKKFIESMIERAKAQRCNALVLTMDFHVQGQRNCDIHNGLGFSGRPALPALLNIATKMRWLWSMKKRPPLFGNIIGHALGVQDMHSFRHWYRDQLILNISWDHVECIKRLWQGPLIIKGVLDADDARRAINAGADALSVSNHGGRQLDGAPSTLEVLPSIVDAVGSHADVLLDGGIRSGQDVLKALALGAKGVLLGRAPLYGLAANGQAGVERVLDLIRNEIDLTMAMCGCKEVQQFNRTHITPVQRLNHFQEHFI